MFAPFGQAYLWIFRNLIDRETDELSQFLGLTPKNDASITQNPPFKWLSGLTVDHCDEYSVDLWEIVVNNGDNEHQESWSI